MKMAPSPESLLNYSSKQLPLVLTDKCTTVWNQKINSEIRPMRVISPPKQVQIFSLYFQCDQFTDAVILSRLVYHTGLLHFE